MKIEANTTLYARSLGDHNCIFDIKVFGRTAKTADILDIYGNRRKAKIYVDDNGDEYLMPERYSMAPIFRAGNTIKPRRDWEKSSAPRVV